ncbi:MAG: ATP-dependent Clp protease ATP-binding subunit ClpB, partial [Solirubrobacteraceae bacterium]|nr:ATP-dependent Clp protease ATP-binding subunit ClpB [Solirubrobacteraceae bacterium]
LLGNLGYDPTYGARPLKRIIQKRLVDRLAMAILEGRFQAGDTVKVEAKDGDLVLARAAGTLEPAAAASTAVESQAAEPAAAEPATTA